MLNAVLLSALAALHSARLVRADSSSSPDSYDPATWIDNYMPTPTSWSLSPSFSDMSPFKVSSYVAATNIAILRGSPAGTNDQSADSMQQAFSSFQNGWNDSVNCLQILYPKGSNAPHNKPQGGAEFYGQPLDLSVASNVSLQYSVYFPPEFDFVKGGKLPGLYGGHKGCSGGDSAVDTRMMWRTNGDGELYLYVPKDKQTPELCQVPPKSICNNDYGLSIGRGAWRFVKGEWTTIRQDIWLNTPGINDGGFNIWINDRLAMSYGQVRYRENAETCGGARAESAETQSATVSAVPEESTWVPVTSATASSDTSVAITSSPTPVLRRENIDYPWSANVWQPSDAASSPSSAPSLRPFRVGHSPPLRADQCAVGFIGLFFSTFFGGHTDDWSPKLDQYTYFKEFKLRINTYNA